MTRDLATISAEIDAICTVARARMEAASDGSIMLYPTEFDWMSAEEAREVSRLQLEHSTHPYNRLTAIRARVAAKRKARREMSSR